MSLFHPGHVGHETVTLKTGMAQMAINNVATKLGPPADKDQSSAKKQCPEWQRWASDVEQSSVDDGSQAAPPIGSRRDAVRTACVDIDLFRASCGTCKEGPVCFPHLNGPMCCLNVDCDTNCLLCLSPYCPLDVGCEG